ncbi:DUF2769 domain-containing protein [Methanomassiliicoccus luminyensis]|jgi:hypothetical protein|uniref:DUF2769 domain-containing protein n=1 Tax=Methanomassiliicoccus luminyensis TaxID=1080712 RepID=UPI00037ABB96|nr:DUF2769 domain-containing protein [Methanomassiliicoccus luminyensis]
MRSLQDLNRLTPEKRKAEIAAMRTRCPCQKCPTYTECAGDRDEKLFCFYGRSPDCISRELKCICPKCPVHDEFGFRKLHYCTRGGESTAPKRF